MLQHGCIATNGINLHYVTEGAGPLLLFLHGFPEFWYSWRHQLPEFGRDYKAVALDLRGYNDSDKPPGRAAYQITELVEDIKGVIQGLGYDRCVLVGHDWGGAVAWVFAYTYPELLEKLIILNLPHPAKFVRGLFTPQQLLRSSYIFFFQLPILPERVLRANDYRWIERVFTQMAVNSTAFSPEDLAAYKAAAAKPGALTAALNYYRNLWRPFPPRTWGVLEVPTQMIWGEQDAALGKELTYGTEVYVRDFQLHYLPNASHWVQQDQPELVNQLMREFLVA